MKNKDNDSFIADIIIVAILFYCCFVIYSKIKILKQPKERQILSINFYKFNSNTHTNAWIRIVIAGLLLVTMTALILSGAFNPN